MTKQEWITEAGKLAQACREFQFAVALDDDDTAPEEIDEFWSLTEVIIREYEEWFCK